MFIETYIALALLAILLPVALVMHFDRAYQRQRRLLRSAQRWDRERKEAMQDVRMHVELLQRVRRYTA